MKETPEEVLARLKRAPARTAPALLAAGERDTFPHARTAGAAPPVPGLAAILGGKPVRCADCREARYCSTPSPRGWGAEPWREWLECRHGPEVTLRDLVTPRRYCTKFNRRPLI